MNCARARFLLYAYLDREPSTIEAEALSRHLASCVSCAVRARSARNLAVLLRSRLDRTPAPMRLRVRLQGGATQGLRPRYRYPLFAGTAAVLLLMLLPLTSDVVRPHARVVRAGLASAPEALALVSRRMTGTFVCLDCEARSEAGLCLLQEGAHQAGFCADNGEVWRLMSPGGRGAEASVGRTATVEGVAFPESGFLRVSRVGY